MTKKLIIQLQHIAVPYLSLGSSHRSQFHCDSCDQSVSLTLEECVTVYKTCWLVPACRICVTWGLFTLVCPGLYSVCVWECVCIDTQRLMYVYMPLLVRVCDLVCVCLNPRQEQCHLLTISATALLPPTCTHTLKHTDTHTHRPGDVWLLDLTCQPSQVSFPQLSVFVLNQCFKGSQLRGRTKLFPESTEHTHTHTRRLTHTHTC